MIEFCLNIGFLFTLGAVIGSFLNVVADRTSRDEDFVKGSSKCDSCGNSLKPQDLFPILSFLVLKGKCRYCKSKLSFYYPLSEFLTGITLVLTYIYSGGFNLNFFYLSIVFCFYICIVLADAKYNLIPNKVVYPAIWFVTVMTILMTTYSLFSYYNKLNSDTFGVYLIQAGIFNDAVINTFKSFAANVTTAIGISGFFILLIAITKGRGMGFGDVRLGFLIGVFNGFPTAILGVFLGFLSGAIVSILLIIFGFKKIKDTIAFGPFLIFGSVVALVWGHKFLVWYLSLY